MERLFAARRRGEGGGRGSRVGAQRLRGKNTPNCRLPTACQSVSAASASGPAVRGVGERESAGRGRQRRERVGSEKSRAGRAVNAPAWLQREASALLSESLAKGCDDPLPLPRLAPAAASAAASAAVSPPHPSPSLARPCRDKCSGSPRKTPERCRSVASRRVGSVS